MKNPVSISRTTETLARYIANAGRTPLPDDVHQKACHHVLDTAAACLSGSTLLAGRKIAGYVERFAGSGSSIVIGTALRTSPEAAALANGMSAHADETDDSHLRGRFHPGCGVFPACLAAAEMMPVSGERFIRAFTLGYDIGTRVNLSMGPRRLYDGGHSTHSVGSLFGGVAAAASILDFDERQVRHSLSYAVQQASGVQCWSRDTEHVEKAFDFGGMPARNAMTAVGLVSSGLSAVDDALDGPNDLYSAFSMDPRREELIEGLGERFEILDTTIKRWCVGSPIQSTIDAVTEIMADDLVEIDDIERIVIHLPDDRCALVDNRDMPAINVQHLVALALVDRSIGFANSHDEARMSDPRVQALRALTTLVPDHSLTIARPARQAIVSILMRSGLTFRKHAKAVRGTPDNPMREDEVLTKVAELCEPVIGSQSSWKLCEYILNVVNFRDTAAMLRPLLSREA